MGDFRGGDFIYVSVLMESPTPKPQYFQPEEKPAHQLNPSATEKTITLGTPNFYIQ